MTVKWQACWYELDQTLVLGDRDRFYLTKDRRFFASGLYSAANEDCEVEAEVVRISHPDLGELRAIIAIGLDYTLYLADGTALCVNAEETPGKIDDPRYAVSDWDLDVVLNILEENPRPAPQETQTQQQARRARYKALLGLAEADWA